MFARVFLRNKHKRIKSFFGCIIFLLSIKEPNLLTKHDIFKSTSELFTEKSIDVYNLLHRSHVILHNAFMFFALSKFKYKNKDSFLKLLLISGVITLNPGPSHINQTSGNNEWDVFKAKGLHFIHINTNSLLPKLEELCGIASLMQLLLRFQNQNLITP